MLKAVILIIRALHSNLVCMFLANEHPKKFFLDLLISPMCVWYVYVRVCACACVCVCVLGKDP